MFVDALKTQQNTLQQEIHAMEEEMRVFVSQSHCQRTSCETPNNFKKRMAILRKRD